MYRILSTICLLFYSLNTFAISATEELASSLNQIKTMKASFNQTVTGQKRGRARSAQGEMYLMRPGQFRWDITSPNKQVIITNNKKLWIYDEDLEQVTIRKLAKEAGEAPALLLSDSTHTLVRSFRVAKLPNRHGLTWFSLIPKRKQTGFTSIYLGFNGHTIQQMQLQDHLGNTTLIRFVSVQTNVSLAPSLFTFRPPHNVDIIDETR